MNLRNFPDREHFRQLMKSSTVVPVCREVLADLETPVSIMHKLYRSSGPVFLLESMEGGERWGRYSFLGVSASRQIRVFKDTIQIERNGSVESHLHDGDPLGYLRSFMKNYRPAAIPQLPRFWGGLVGYMAYEMVSFIEAIPNRLSDDQPVAHFIMPDELLIFDNIANTLMLVAIAHTDTHADADAAFHDATARIESIYEQIRRPLKPENVSSAPFSSRLASEVDEDAFRRRVAIVKEYIQAGDIIQAVISQPFVCAPPKDLLALYRAQRYVNPSPYLFFLHLDSMALIGSSPETMVRLENGIATLRPIAGTRPRGESEQVDRSLADELLKDEKERAEHLMLVDLGRNDLGRVAETGTVQVTDLMVVERYSHVMHLVSNIVCDLQKGL